MAELIGIDTAAVRAVAEDIRGIDNALIGNYFGSLVNLLNRINATVQEDTNTVGYVNRVASSAIFTSEALSSSLKALESFLDEQLQDYEVKEEAAFEALSAVLEKMAELVGLDFSVLPIASQQATDVSTGDSDNPAAEDETPAPEEAPASEGETPAPEEAPASEGEMPTPEVAPASEGEISTPEVAPEVETQSLEAAPVSEDVGPVNMNSHSEEYKSIFGF